MTSNFDFSGVKELVYDKCAFEIKNFVLEKESREYDACTFEINKSFVIARRSKITPTKTGQFVTVWKRIGNGPIQAFDSSDRIDFFIINTCSDNCFGQFVFPISELVKQGIISTEGKGGKRAFRVYPPWDKTNSKQAEKTQKWQLKYFLSLDIDQPIDLDRAKFLYSKTD
ncbi:MepB family protein [Labilibaculum antarcticum]|uniref:MepB domain containing protein n=1 Tax=Labilibaculum antarcticum TaxID=1717717 RepID=A0A1Y1CF92_9BACT|nr:MepB family protein [Labilibaculum antarcticum]BAX78702.1 MepB domain containing protein [Labilibaculum antarcticum]